MKTAREWFEQDLDEEHRAGAIEALGNEKYGSLSEALLMSFDWVVTTEGAAYWAKVRDDMEAVETATE